MEKVTFGELRKMTIRLCKNDRATICETGIDNNKVLISIGNVKQKNRTEEGLMITPFDSMRKLDKRNRYWIYLIVDKDLGVSKKLYNKEDDHKEIIDKIKVLKPKDVKYIGLRVKPLKKIKGRAEVIVKSKGFDKNFLYKSHNYIPKDESTYEPRAFATISPKEEEKGELYKLKKQEVVVKMLE